MVTLCQVCTFTAANAGSLSGVGARLGPQARRAVSDALNQCLVTAPATASTLPDLIAMPCFPDYKWCQKLLHLFVAYARLFAQRPKFDQALPDYDMAISLKLASAMVLNQPWRWVKSQAQPTRRRRWQTSSSRWRSASLKPPRP